MEIIYEKRHKDGSVEILTPHEHSDGTFRVEIKVSKLEMEKWAAKGANVRMSGAQSSPSIVPPKITKP